MSGVISYRGMSEITPYCLYDTCELVGTGTYTHEFFHEPRSTQKNLVLKTDGDGWFLNWLRTNLSEPNRLPAPQEFIVKRLNVLFLRDGKPLSLYDCGLYGSTAISFSINQKSYWESPAWACASPLAFFTNSYEQIDALVERWGIKWDRVGANFDHPSSWAGMAVKGLKLHRQEPFRVVASVTGPFEAGMQLAVYLDGPILRAVI